MNRKDDWMDEDLDFWERFSGYREQYIEEARK